MTILAPFLKPVPYDLPLKPGLHSQVKLLVPSTHSPPPGKQGDDMHSSMFSVQPLPDQPEGQENSEVMMDVDNVKVRAQ